MAALTELMELFGPKPEADHTEGPALPTPPKAAPVKQPDEPGDVVIQRAKEQTGLSSEQGKFFADFINSKKLVDAQIAENPIYRNRVMPMLWKMDMDTMIPTVIDLAEQLQMEQQRAEDPDRFHPGLGAVTSFVDSALFGQLPKVMAGIGTMVGNEPYEALVEKKAKEFRLLQKANPDMWRLGDVASYFIPGSPAKMAFALAATRASRIAKPLIMRLAKNPGLMRRVMDSAAAMGAGSGIVGGIRGMLGEGSEGFDLDRGFGEAVNAGLFGSLFGAGVPLAAGFVGTTAIGAATATSGASKMLARRVAKTLEQTTGLPSTVLRAGHKNAAALRNAAGSEAKIGDDLTEFLASKQNKMAERIAADDLLPELPDVPVAPLLRVLRQFEKGISPENQAIGARLGEWAANIEAGLPRGYVKVKGGYKAVPITYIDPNFRAPATQVRAWVDRMQQFVSDKNAYMKHSGPYLETLKAAAATARISIVRAAEKEGGELGTTYVNLMKQTAKQRGLVKFLSKQLGSNPEMMAARSESWISRVFGKNQKLIARRLGDLDREFGTNFLEQTKLAHQARVASGRNMAPGLQKPSGELPLLPTHGTGGALVATGIGGALGAGIGEMFDDPSRGARYGAAVGAVLSSPWLASRVIGASDTISGFSRRLISNPAALERLLGRVSKQPGVKGMARRTALRVPMEVKFLAQQIHNTLTVDGPQSASSVVRIIADTPYFVGLVHYFDIADRMSRRRGQSSIAPEVGKQQGRQP